MRTARGTAKTTRTGGIARYAGYGAAVWGVLFAIPSFYWAAGGTAGAATTVSPSLVRLASERVGWFIAVLWITGALKLLGAVIGVGLLRARRPGLVLLLLLGGAGAGVLLAWHGALFVIEGALVESGVLHVAAGLRPISRWYTYLWGPWFVLGGLCFLAAVRHRLATDPSHPRARPAALTGALGAAALSVLLLLAGIG